MRLLVALGAVVCGLSFLSFAGNVAEAKNRRHVLVSHDYRGHVCDAARLYRGYPDWARAAFTCGGT